MLFLVVLCSQYVVAASPRCEYFVVASPDTVGTNYVAGDKVPVMVAAFAGSGESLYSVDFFLRGPDSSFHCARGYPNAMNGWTLVRGGHKDYSALPPSLAVRDNVRVNVDTTGFGDGLYEVAAIITNRHGLVTGLDDDFHYVNCRSTFKIGYGGRQNCNPVSPPSCTSEWECSRWSACSNDVETCVGVWTDKAGCGGVYSGPQMRACESNPVPLAPEFPFCGDVGLSPAVGPEGYRAGSKVRVIVPVNAGRDQFLKSIEVFIRRPTSQYANSPPANPAAGVTVSNAMLGWDSIAVKQFDPSAVHEETYWVDWDTSNLPSGDYEVAAILTNHNGFATNLERRYDFDRCRAVARLYSGSCRTIVSCEAQSFNTIMVNLAPVSGASKYRVEWKKSGSEKWSGCDSVAECGMTESYNLAGIFAIGLNSRTSYDFRAKVILGCEGDYSSVAGCATQAIPDVGRNCVPVEVKVHPVSGSSIVPESDVSVRASSAFSYSGVKFENPPSGKLVFSGDNLCSNPAAKCTSSPYVWVASAKAPKNPGTYSVNFVGIKDGVTCTQPAEFTVARPRLRVLSLSDRLSTARTAVIYESVPDEFFSPVDFYVGGFRPQRDPSRVYSAYSLVLFGQPAGSVQGARLKLFADLSDGLVVDYQASPLVLDVYRISSSWSRPTWNNQPSFSEMVGSVVVTGSGEYELDVTSLVNSWSQNPETNYGILLKGRSADANVKQFTVRSYIELGAQGADVPGPAIPPPPEVGIPGSYVNAVHTGPALCDERPEARDYDDSAVDSGWVYLDGSSSIFTVSSDPASPAACPLGFIAKGSVHSGPGVVNNEIEAVDYLGHSVDSGWVTLCSKDDAHFIISYDDCTGVSAGCSPGFVSVGKIHAGPGNCVGTDRIVDSSGKSTKSGWVTFCSKDTASSIKIARDDCAPANVPSKPVLSSPQDGISVQSASPQLVWQAPSSRIYHYHIQVTSVDGLGPGISLVVGDQALVQKNLYVLPANYLIAGKEYKWRVRFSNSELATPSEASFGGWSDEWTFRYSPITPNAPKLLSPQNSAVLNVYPDFVWENPASRIYHYHIQVLPLDGSHDGIDVAIGDQVLVQKNSYKLPAGFLQQNKEYKWRVRFSNANVPSPPESSFGPWSEERKFTYVGSLSGKCSDGTLYNSCSLTKPIYCNQSQILLENCGKCGCPDDKPTCNHNTGACTSVKYCEDSTPYNSCSVSRPFYCDAGSIKSNCKVCGCPPGQVCESDSCKGVSCSDGTPRVSCSMNKPYYCNESFSLVSKCGRCGCPGNMVCGSDGICNPSERPPADVQSIDVPVLVLNYFPLKNDEIDISLTADWQDKSLDNARKQTKMLADFGVEALTKGSAYHGYKNPNSISYLKYRVLETKELLKPVKRQFGFLDGDITTGKWAPSYPFEGDYLLLDFGSSKSFERVTLSFWAFDRPEEFRVLVSETGRFLGEEREIIKELKGLDGYTGTGPVQSKTYSFPRINTRYVKFVIDKYRTGGIPNPGSQLNLYEFSVGLDIKGASAYSNEVSAASPDNFAMLEGDVNVCDYVDNRRVKEVWVFMYHNDKSVEAGMKKLDYFVIPDESNMAIGTQSRVFWNFDSHGDVSNSVRSKDLPVCRKSYSVYQYNYGRGKGEVLENHGHHIEAILNWIDGRETLPQKEWNNLLFWGDFVGSDISHKIVKQLPSCGWTHYAPNSKNDYEWRNENPISSECEDWIPGHFDSVKSLDCHTWYGAVCVDDGGAGFKIWWMQNIPGKDNGILYDGKNLRNWWEFIGDFDNALAKGKNLVES